MDILFHWYIHAEIKVSVCKMQEISPSVHNSSFMDQRPILSSFLVILFLALGMIYHLSFLPLFEPDESRYVEVSREMLETGEYIIPQLNYEIRLNKPAMFHWILAAGFRVMGVNSFSARLLSIVASIGLLAVTGLFAWRHLGRDARVPLSIGLLGSSALFWWMSRIAMVDIYLCFCISSALFLLFDWEQNRERKRSLWLAALAVAAGVNLKGPVAFALPAFIFVIYIAVKGEMKTVWKSAPWLRWILAAVLLSIPWYLLATIQLGRTAGQYFFIDELFGRFFTDQFKRSRPIYYYFMLLPVLLLPWTLLAFQSFWSQRINLRSQGLRYWIRNNPVHGYTIIWTLGTLLFFSMCKSKMIHYLIPLIPPAAVLTADWIHLWTRNRARRFTWVTPILILTLTGIAVAVLDKTMEPVQTGIPILIVCAMGGILYAVYISFWRFTGYFVHFLGLILTSMIFYQLVIVGLTRDREIWPNDIEFAQFVRSWAAPGASIYSLYSYKPSLLTAVQRPIQKISELAEVEKIMQSDRPALLLSQKNVADAIINQDLKKEDKEYLQKYIPYERDVLIYNKAYADACFYSESNLELAPKGDVRLVAIGDPGGFWREPFEMANVLSRLSPKPDAVLLLGDNIFLHPTRKYRRMDTPFESPYKSLLEQGIPFYASLGDYDRPIAEWLINYPLFHMEGKRFYSKSFGENLVDCFFLDSGGFENHGFFGKSGQIDWIARSLEHSKATWKMVVMHSPLLPCPDDYPPTSSQMQDNLTPVLQNYQVPVIVSGSGAWFSRYQNKQKITQFIVGDGTCPPETPTHSGVDFSCTQGPVFLVLDLFPSEIKTTAISAKGKIVDRYTVQWENPSVKITSHP